MKLQGAVDSPVSGASYYRQRLLVEGWVHGDYRHDRIKRVTANALPGEIGSTTHFYARADVNAALHLPATTRTGFRFLAAFVEPTHPRGTVDVEIRIEFNDGTIVPLAGLHVKLLENDFTGAPYGNLCNPQHTEVLHREHLYSTGHPAETASPACVRLLTDYLPPGSSLLDVGCGVGAYCEPLRKAGHSWMGCETSIECLHGLAMRSRPHRAISRPFWPWSRYRLPAADREFDAALVIEVLEHIREPDPFLAEVARVTRRFAFFSVPNLETLPFLADRLAAPWHMLEGDHVNFFTRFNLRPLLARHFRHVEIMDYGAQPLASPDGLPLPFHLFALCEV